MGVNSCLWSELKHKQWPGKVAVKNMNANIFAYELRVKGVDTFGLVLYHNQWPVNDILHFAELHMWSPFGNYFLKGYIVKRI